MNRKTIALLTDAAIAGVMLVYILSLNPTYYIYLRNYYRYVAYHTWKLLTPPWMIEALKVRGFISSE